MNGRHGSLVRAGAVLLVSLFAAPMVAQPAGDRLWQHRNLGKAFYENPTTQRQAVEEFRQALALAPESARERVNYGLALLRAGRSTEGMAELERAKQQDPSIPHTWFNLGIAYKKASEYDRSALELEQMVRLAPADAISHYNLGYAYKLTARPAQALVAFERAAELDPNLAGARFQLYNAYKDAGRNEDAERELKTFQELKRRQAGAAVPEDLDWGYYAEIYDPTDATLAVDDSVPAALRFATAILEGRVEPGASGLRILDADGDGRTDLLVWSAERIRIHRSGKGAPGADPIEVPGVVRDVAVADFDNDGRQDLAVASDAGVSLYANRDGRFEPASLPAARGPVAAVAWVDYDHDYDLDLLAVGDRALLLRNGGTAGFEDRTADLAFVRGRATAVTTLTIEPDTVRRDILVAYADRGGVLYADRFGGRYDVIPLDLVPAGTTQLAAADLDDDGAVEVIAGGPAGVRWLRHSGGDWTAAPLLPAVVPFALADLERRGLDDLVAPLTVLRNGGLGRFVARPVDELGEARALVAADFDGDANLDLAAVGPDGAVRILRNTTETGHHWIRVGLAGVRNPRLAHDAVVEVKAGRSYQRRVYAGLPLIFGLRDADQVETVRITWPNGLIQNEVRQAAGQAVTYKEAQRLSGSCPMIFTWDGREHRFITDVLGVAPLGASAGEGQYFPVDHDEFVQIPGEALVARDGALDVRVTEELREVSYLDRLRLIAVDHPADLALYTNDKFKAPPFPEFKLFGVRRKIRPVAARDDRGHDVRNALLAIDHTYPDTFERTYSGVAEPHALELDFGPAAPGSGVVLVLHGWVDWADGSTFVGAAQERPGGLAPPSLQVRDAAGRWVTVIDDMGMPAGKPKAIVVDLGDKFLSTSREVRIVTSLCVYWDEIFLAEDATLPEARMATVPLLSADLRFRGFSTPIVDPERRQPEVFDYGRLVPLPTWNPIPGLYTRYGDVGTLLAEADDQLVVMGSGDEVVLRFDAASLPAPAEGWRRDYLLQVDGWAKDGDANTAFSQTVEPLPFRGMTRYPYPASERFPDDEAHARYRRELNTRPALRLLRPLAAPGPRPPAPGSR